MKMLDSGDVADHPYQTQFQAFFDALDRGEEMPLTSFARRTGSSRRRIGRRGKAIASSSIPRPSDHGRHDADQTERPNDPTFQVLCLGYGFVVRRLPAKRWDVELGAWN